MLWSMCCESKEQNKINFPKDKENDLKAEWEFTKYLTVKGLWMQCCGEASQILF
jgi:hypothetical protein